MLYQGEMVGNRNGLLLNVTQKGEVVPRGMPNSVDGTVAPATASLLSGRALSGRFRAAQTQNEKNVSFNFSFLLFIHPN